MIWNAHTAFLLCRADFLRCRIINTAEKLTLYSVTRSCGLQQSRWHWAITCIQHLKKYIFPLFIFLLFSIQHCSLSRWPGWEVQTVRDYPDRNWLWGLCHPLQMPHESDAVMEWAAMQTNLGNWTRDPSHQKSLITVSCCSLDNLSRETLTASYKHLTSTLECKEVEWI